MNRTPVSATRRIVVIAAVLAAMTAAAQAQVANPPQGASPAPPTVTPPSNTIAVPGFWIRGGAGRGPVAYGVIRFLTETDYPPFNYADRMARPPASMSIWRG